MKLVLEQVAIFAGAFLLFQVQPLMGRWLLPWFGGSPSVWTACLLFFQLLLLAGYAWSHSVAGSRSYQWIHLSLLGAAAVLTTSAQPSPPTGTHPTWEVLRILAVNIGVPYFVLSTASPLIQRFSASAAPYRLYALSNAGSLIGLLSYPFVIEPIWGLHRQWRIWTFAFAAFCAVYSFIPVRGAAQRNSGGGWNWLWPAASAGGSVLLMAVTNQMTQEIAASPFLWVLPLALYLITFILAFGSARFYRPALFAGLIAAALPLACIVKAVGLRAPLLAHIVVNAVALFVGAMICHGELAASKPPREGLTRFYLMISVGGALGGLLVALVAPLLFTNFAEFEIALAAPCLLLLRSAPRGTQRILVLAILIAGATLLSEGSGTTLASNRNFFGLLRVSEEGGKRSLSHGRVTHGYQFTDPARRDWPTAYYGPESALGKALTTMPRPMRVGVIGLGVGTAAAYTRPGDVMRFYEINPEVERFARRYFTYLSDAKGKVEVVIGDARMELEKEPAQAFDLLAVDAFSSDSVPAHLLTTQAADVYRRHLKPGGRLLFHITNQYLDLEPVVRGLAQHLGMPAKRVESPGDESRGTSAAVWMVVGEGEIGGRAQVWTDDRISLWRILK